MTICPNLSDDQVKLAFSKFDTSGDDKLDYREFCEMIKQKVGGGGVRLVLFIILIQFIQYIQYQALCTNPVFRMYQIFHNLPSISFQEMERNG